MQTSACKPILLSSLFSPGCDFPLLNTTSTFGWEKSNPTEYLFILIDHKENLKAPNQPQVYSKQSPSRGLQRSSNSNIIPPTECSPAAALTEYI